MTIDLINFKTRDFYENNNFNVHSSTKAKHDL